MINGKRYSKSMKTIGLTKAEIEKAHANWIVEVECGRVLKASYTFKEWCDVWLETYEKPICRPRVIRSYNFNLQNHLIPKFGSTKLENITPLMIDNYILELKHTKSINNPSKNLSVGTIKKIFAIFKNIMNTAFKNDLITKNPFDKVTLVFSDMEKESKLHFWQQTDYKKTLELLKNETSDNKYLVEFALKTGLRLSEIFGLDWDNIDFENNTINIEKSRQKVDGVMCIFPTKTSSSRRKITIPQSVTDLLKEQQEKHPNNEYVFSNLDPDNSTSWYRKWVKHNNLPYITFHDLRHTHASLLLYQGIDIKTISQRLGHSNIGITMNVYTHVVEELDRKASLAIDAI
jgi:integrase